MEKTKGKFITFLKKNAVYVVLALCVLAVGLSVALTIFDGKTTSVDSTLDASQDSVGSVDENDKVDAPVDVPNEPVSTVITFIMPVQNATEIGEYSESMVFNSLLGRFSTHMAVDFFAPEGTLVYATYGGTIESVENTLLKGTSITIDHGNGLKTVYNSILDGDRVTVGQTVKQGDVIGEISVSNRQEADLGAHLHFEVYENGVNIDPAKYLTFDEK